MVDIRAAAASFVDRVLQMRRDGLTFGGKRDTYVVLGYERYLTPKDYTDRFERGGVAGRVVDAYPIATWRGRGELVEDESPNVLTQFEAAWFALAKKFKIWSVLQRADLLSGLGRYSTLLIGATGELSTPLGRSPLLYLTPFSESDAQIQEFDSNTASERFGQPLTYTLKRTDIVSPALSRPVHYSRILHLAEKPLDTEIYGLPRLQRVWNLLDDLDKVTGGGAESFWLRANQGMHLNVDKDIKEVSPEVLAEYKEQAEAYAHQVQRMLRTRGVTVTPLGSDVADFSGPADTILTQISGSIGIPKRILTGSEMGQLASGQDRDNWDTQVQDRRTSHAGPNIVEPLVEKLIVMGALPKPKQYEVRWPAIENLTETEKAAGAKQWADTKTADGKAVFTAEEIRDHWYGMEPLEVDDLAGIESTTDEAVNQLEAAIRSAGSVTLVVK